MAFVSDIFGFMFHSIQSFGWVFYAATTAISCWLMKDAWMAYREEVYKHGIVWTLVEIKIPRETMRGAKAMDQVLASIYNLRNDPVGLKETYWDGEITRWFSFEIVGSQRTTRLFARLPKFLLHPFVSSFYAQYPDVEIYETEEDYIDAYPKTYQGLKAKGFEMYGLEITQAKNPAQSLRTYVEFETKVGDEKGRIIDPMASILEIIGRLKPDETVWLQFEAIPDTIGAWIKDADRIIKKMKETSPGEQQSKDSSTPFRLRFRTQGEEKTLERVEDKKGKAIFETIIRCIYFAPKAIFNQDLPNRGVFGYIAQLNDDDQRVKKVNRVRTKVEWEGFPPLIFRFRRLFWKRVAMYDEYRKRFIPAKTFVGKILNSYWLRLCFFHKPMILSSAELATMFHIPTNVVLTAATMERIESKKLSAPSNLPR